MLFSIKVYVLINVCEINFISATGVTSGTGTAYPFGAPEFVLYFFVG